jgi:hypothetical protein
MLADPLCWTAADPRRAGFPPRLRCRRSQSWTAHHRSRWCPCHDRGRGTPPSEIQTPSDRCLAVRRSRAAGEWRNGALGGRCEEPVAGGAVRGVGAGGGSAAGGVRGVGAGGGSAARRCVQCRRGAGRRRGGASGAGARGRLPAKGAGRRCERPITRKSGSPAGRDGPLSGNRSLVPHPFGPAMDGIEPTLIGRPTAVEVGWFGYRLGASCCRGSSRRAGVPNQEKRRVRSAGRRHFS